VLRGVGAGADEDGGRLAEATGDRQHLGGGLLHRTARVVDEDEDFSHGCAPCLLSLAQTNLWVVRNSASLVPPSPSSVTMVPCSRGGRLLVASTWVQALARPTWPASTPRSARAHSSTGFFFAAMIPLKEG